MTKIEFEKYVTNDLQYTVDFDTTTNADSSLSLLFTKHNNGVNGIYVSTPKQGFAKVKLKSGQVLDFLVNLNRPISQTYELYTLQSDSLILVKSKTMQMSETYLGANADNNYVFTYYGNLLIEEYLKDLELEDQKSKSC